MLQTLQQEPEPVSRHRRLATMVSSFCRGSLNPSSPSIATISWRPPQLGAPCRSSSLLVSQAASTLGPSPPMGMSSTLRTAFQD